MSNPIPTLPPVPAPAPLTSSVPSGTLSSYIPAYDRNTMIVVALIVAVIAYWYYKGKKNPFPNLFKRNAPTRENFEAEPAQPVRKTVTERF